MIKLKKMLFLLIVLSLAGCSNRDNSEDIEKEYMSLLDEELRDGELINYIDGDINLVSAIPHTVSSKQFFEFVLEANMKSTFGKLTDEEKYELFKELDTAYLDTSCGEFSNCNIDTFTFIDNDDTYSVSPFYGFEVSKNDEDFNPKPVQVTTTNGESNTGSNFDKQAIYSFMKLKYEEVTNYGENYDPDIHDPLVARLAATQFGISESEAGQIYIEMDMVGY